MILDASTVLQARALNLQPSPSDWTIQYGDYDAAGQLLGLHGANGSLTVDVAPTVLLAGPVSGYRLIWRMTFLLPGGGAPTTLELFDGVLAVPQQSRRTPTSPAGTLIYNLRLGWFTFPYNLG